MGELGQGDDGTLSGSTGNFNGAGSTGSADFADDFIGLMPDDAHMDAILARGQDLSKSQLADLSTSSELSFFARVGYAVKANLSDSAFVNYASKFASQIPIVGNVISIGNFANMAFTMATGQINSGDPSSGETDNGPGKTISQWLSDPNAIAELQSKYPDLNTVALKQQFEQEVAKIAVSQTLGTRPATRGLDQYEYDERVRLKVEELVNNTGDLKSKATVPVWYDTFLQTGELPVQKETVQKETVQKETVSTTTDETGTDTETETTEDPTSVTNSTDSEGDLWNQFVDRAVNDLEGLTQENADFRRTEAEQYNQTIGTATAKDNSVLSGLASDLNNETGTFTPTQTNWGTYQPGSNFIKSRALTGFSSAEKDNTINAATSKYGTVSDRSPVIDTLQYLAGLEGIATTDRESLMQKYVADLNAESSKYAVDNNVSMNNSTIAANEPGVLDNIVSGVNAGVGIADMGKMFGWWG